MMNTVQNQELQAMGASQLVAEPKTKTRVEKPAIMGALNTLQSLGNVASEAVSRVKAAKLPEGASKDAVAAKAKAAAKAVEAAAKAFLSFFSKKEEVKVSSQLDEL